MSLTPYPKQDFRYNPKGEYHNIPSDPNKIRFRKRTNQTTDPKFGKVCPGCGITTPRSGKCGQCWD